MPRVIGRRAGFAVSALLVVALGAPVEDTRLG